MIKKIILLLLLTTGINFANDSNIIKGIYITGDYAGKGRIKEILTECRNSGVNAFVIDLKTMEGFLSYPSTIPLAQKIEATKYYSIKDYQLLIKQLKEHDFYIIGRTTVFYDDLLSTKRQDLALYLNYVESNDTVIELIPWVNPENNEVIEYNLDIIKEAITFGFHEIQLDYIRYPAVSGKISDFSGTLIPYEKRKEMIYNFCREAKKITEENKIKLSIDIFGVTAWNREEDTKKIGQDISLLGKEIDIICPMFYPSHFYQFILNGNEASENPELLLEIGCNKIKSLLPDSANVIIRPWLQSFTYRVPNFNYFYILKQIFGCLNSGTNTFLFWNAGVKYDSTFKALEMLKRIESAPKVKDNELIENDIQENKEDNKQEG